MPEDYKIKNISLKGKLVTAIDSSLIGENFSVLQNMRYTDGGIASISGMTKINTTQPANQNIKNMFHFRKYQPSESHVLIQSADGSGNTKIYDNTTAIPSTGDFGSSLHTDSTGSGIGRFSTDSLGEVAYCNSKETMIWGGNEFRCSGFIVYDPSGTFFYDYSSIITNTINDAQNIASLYSATPGIDANTMLMLHLNNNVTDNSPTTPHTVTNVNVTFDATNKVFGSHSGSFNGTTAYLSVPDNADFDFSGGIWTVDGRIRITSLAANRTIYYQATDATNYMAIYVMTTGAVRIYIRNTGGVLIDLSTGAGAITTNTFYHVEVTENGDDWYIFVNGIQQVYLSSTNRAANYTGVVKIGTDGTSWYVGQIDEFRVSNSARHVSAFSIPTSEYSASASSTYMYVGSVRPLKGIKFYIGTVNTQASTLSVQYWNGTSWVMVSNISDGTAVAGAPFAQNGVVSFDTTDTIAKVKSINQTVLYWYIVSATTMDSTTTIYHVTLDAPFQSIKDIWDGVLRTPLSFQLYKSTIYTDNTTNVMSDNYNSADTTTYSQLGALATSTDSIYVGFSEPTLGLDIILGGSSVNTTANTVCTVKYWNGTAWTSVGVIEDGTSQSSKSLNKSGIISWNAITQNVEFKKEVNKGVPLYFYQLSFNQNLSADVRIDRIGGIPSQTAIYTYKFPVFANGRLFLCSRQDQDKNSVIVSAQDTSNVFNGDDSATLFFGDDEELVAGAGLYSQFGSSLYNIVVLCKYSQTWILTGSSPETWTIYQASDTVGCASPLTMKLAHVGFELVPGQNRYVIIWQGAEGIYLFDGRTVRPIHEDIKDYFDKRKSYSINRNKIGNSVSFFDEFNQEYHWLFASGTSVTLDKEFVFDLKKMKWFEVVRTAKLQAGCEAIDTIGNKYTYGGLGTGYVERLENGTDFDGSSIVSTFQIGDLPLENNIFVETTFRKIKLGMVAKSITTNSVTGTHYGDTNTTGTTFTMSPVVTGKRVAQVIKGEKFGPSIFHSLKFSMTTSDETIGFEPLYLEALYKVARMEQM